MKYFDISQDQEIIIQAENIDEARAEFLDEMFDLYQDFFTITEVEFVEE